MATVRELEEKYKISINNVPMDGALMSDICACGHHITEHHGVGSAGYCEICNPSGKITSVSAIHNFTPQMIVDNNHVMHGNILDMSCPKCGAVAGVKRVIGDGLNYYKCNCGHEWGTVKEYHDYMKSLNKIRFW